MKIKVTGRTEYMSRSEYYVPSEEIVVSVKEGASEEAIQEAIQKAVEKHADLEWEFQHDKDKPDGIHYFFECVGKKK